MKKLCSYHRLDVLQRKQHKGTIKCNFNWLFTYRVTWSIHISTQKMIAYDIYHLSTILLLSIVLVAVSTK